MAVKSEVKSQFSSSKLSENECEEFSILLKWIFVNQCLRNERFQFNYNTTFHIFP